MVLAGETGSGKTTQIPKMCLEAGLGQNGIIGCTQPRRVAALSISRRLAQELGVEWGRGVGCKIRFKDQTSPQTVVKVMTDGMLLAETQGDPDLRQYECIIIDEAHERSLNIDFLLGWLKGLLARRPDLKLVITSATIDTQAFSKAFGNAPIIEVSGRLYPVEVRYAPLDELAEEEGDQTYVDAAVRAVEQILNDDASGDILIFMPGEKDIRETRDALEGRYSGICEVVPLFGRLSSGEQEKVFQPGTLQRIIISTNIAETSLTIPRIKYVIDAGLARLSRYSPRTRTKRLPIEPVSQSSANQRKGRCGRVQNGICVRLYSEEDFEKRPPYTQPEIQRANLAEVILRMKAFHLGEIETFPFLNPPQPAAIRAGYQLLVELGALDLNHALTPLGWDLAQLPVDPAIGRMLLQATKEKALAEILVIAAGLSIQDPRERPMDQKEAADQAHKRFVHPRSDFLTLLNIWNAYHDEFESLSSQSQMRRFCKAHFLSYLRMREWRDTHAQLEESLENIDFTSLGPTLTQIRKPQQPPATEINEALYAAIHRSVLTGLLTHLGQRKERNLYKVPGNREAAVFPASGLHDRRVENNRERSKRAPVLGTFQPGLVVAGELVETSRLFLRTLAEIQPAWVAELGAHICTLVHENPHWSRKAGRVLAREKVCLGGIEILERQVAFGNVNPKAATEIFIRQALIEEELEGQYSFLDHNRKVRERIETYQTRMREAGFPDLDEGLFRFYQKQLENVSSTHDLNRALRTIGSSLFVSEDDLLNGKELKVDGQSFPEAITIEGRPVPLEYAYAPGESHDGLTVRVPATLANQLQPGKLQWIVPAWREEIIRHLLKGLPKALRVPLMPIEPKVKEIAASLNPTEQDLLEELRRFIHQRYRMEVPANVWAIDVLPDYLRPRVEILGPENKILAAGKDLAALHAQARRAEMSIEEDAFTRAAERFERYEIEAWNFPDPPERVEIPTRSGIPLVGYSGLKAEQGRVSLRLFRRREEAITETAKGMARLAEFAFDKDLAWLEKDLRNLNSVKDLYVTLGPGDELTETAFENLRAHLFEGEGSYPPSSAVYERVVATARQRLPGLAPKAVQLIRQVLELRQQLLLSRKPYPGMVQDLGSLMPRRFLASTPHEWLKHFPRFLKGYQLRAERAQFNLEKDSERQRQVAPYLQRLAALRLRKDLDSTQRRDLEEFRWLIEEFKVSLFAQELGTSQPVSAKRLDKFLQDSRL